MRQIYKLSRHQERWVRRTDTFKPLKVVYYCYHFLCTLIYRKLCSCNFHLQGTTLSAFLQEKIWQKIGMQYEAIWSLDNKRENSFEKSFSNFNCTAIDLAKLGRLYLNKGVWDNEQILSESYIYDATRRDTTNGSSWNFQYNFKLGPKQYESYYTRGLYGQLLYIYPKMNVIIVRIGEVDLKYNPQFINNVVIQIIDQI